MMESSAGDLFAVPAWWDPKARRMIFNPTTIVMGMLVMDATSIAYASEDGLVFEATRDELDVTWLPVRSGCDIRISGRSFRLYFGSPVEGAPQIPAQESELAVMVGHLEGTAVAAEAVGGTVGDVADFAGGLVGPVFKAYSAIGDLRDARKRFTAVRTRLGG
ncbi:hypothetical protein [Nonomuraea sp. NPDC048826]|uniref:hypothetical protein n=1 Tax=Nonomuraea sp. NPDC048826 TaxID=3364347 RepID=UPI003720A910